MTNILGQYCSRGDKEGIFIISKASWLEYNFQIQNWIIFGKYDFQVDLEKVDYNEVYKSKVIFWSCIE